MSLYIERFFHACSPSRTLVVTDAEDRKYYIDFSSVRGGKIIQELARTITHLSPNQPTCQLFTGHIGCGKSTELFRLKADLEQQNFHVVYFESSESLDMADVDITDILLSIARAVIQSLETRKITIKLPYFQNLFKEIKEFFASMKISGELSLGIAKISAEAKDSPGFRNQLRQYLEPRTNGILESINNELLVPAKEELKKQGKKGLVVIVDNLDRIDNLLKPTGYSQPEYLFVERGSQLKQLNCHIVYTIPLILIFSNTLVRLTDRFGVDPKVLPMVPVQLRDGSECQQGMTLLKKMVMARAFPDLSWEETQNLIPEVFKNPESLDIICKVSGGHLRNLLMLLFRSLQREDPPLSSECLESVIKQRRNELSLATTAHEWKLLQEVAKNKSCRGLDNYETLLRNMFVFEYRYQDESWFDINPILAQARELTI